MIATAFAALMAMTIADPAEDRAKMAEALGMPAEVGEQLFARAIPSEQARSYVDASAPDPFIGSVTMTVRSARRLDDRIYLNSERNYRDPANVTVVIDEKRVMRRFDEHFGGPIEDMLRDKPIQVAGVLAAVPLRRNADQTRLQMYAISPYQIERTDR